MTKEGLDVLSIMRENEKTRTLKFWKTLLEEGAKTDVECPITSEAPESAIFFGVLPAYMRGPYVKALELHKENRHSEAQVLDEALSDLLNEHFKDQLEKKRARGDDPIAEFRIAKDWHVYALPRDYLKLP